MSCIPSFVWRRTALSGGECLSLDGVLSVLRKFPPSMGWISGTRELRVSTLNLHVRPGFAIAFAVGLIALNANVSLAAQAETTPVAISDVPTRLGEFQKLRTAVQSVIGPLPGIAISPTLTLGALTGVALVCRTSVRSSLSGACEAPLLVAVDRSASLGIFVALSVFAFICYLANTGKIQGLAGKILKLVEAIPALLAYFLVAQTLLGQMTADSTPAATTAAAGILPSAILAAAAASALAAMIVVRLAVEFVVWLSPFPFVDLFVETGEKVVAACFLFLLWFSPGTAAAIAVVILIATAMMLGWAVRTIEFVIRVLLQPLAARLFDLPEASLIDQDAGEGFVAEPTPSVVVRAAAVGVRGFRPRTSGALVKTMEGLYFVVRRLGRRPRLHRLDGPESDRALCLVRCALWIELQVSMSGTITERYVLPVSSVPFQIQLASALGAAYVHGPDTSSGLERFFTPSSV